MFIIILAILNPISFILLFFLEAKRKEQRAQLDGGILDYSLIARIVSVLGLSMCAFIDYLALNGQDEISIIHRSLFVGIVIFIGWHLLIPFSVSWLFAEVFFTNIRYSPSGITIHTAWKGTRSIEWKNIQMVTFVNTWKGGRLFLIDLSGGQLKIAADFSGFGDLVLYTKEHLLPSISVNSGEAFDLALEFAQSRHKTV